MGHSGKKLWGSLMLDAMLRVAEKRGLSSDHVLERIIFLESPEGADTLNQIVELSLGLEQPQVDLPAVAALKILSYIGTINIPFEGRFVANECFVINTGNTDVTRVSYLGGDFRSWFLAKVEDVASERKATYHSLLKNSLNAPILKELGGEVRAETNLAAVWYLMSHQKNGEFGVLLTDGRINVFYVRDINGILRAVSVCWCEGGWYVRACSVGDLGGWDAGYRVFSHNL